MNPEEKYQGSEELTRLADEILEAAPEWLYDAREFDFDILFSNVDSEHYGGKCKKNDDLTRFKTHKDFEIIIYKPNFDRVKPDEKARIVIHELRHIMKDDKGRPAVRRHEGDFCEIPSHDMFSKNVYSRIKDRIPTLTKMPFQTTMEESMRGDDEVSET
ncbi:MAG: hypothetical protein JRN68_06615 [Nitrososphaerota archaeon]|nr:hypothetical protein [Nitrososphaerota archaeon]